MPPLRACKSFGLFLPELGPRSSRPFLCAPELGQHAAAATLDSIVGAVPESHVAIEQEDALA
jgi:hypothetical protein